MDSDVTTTYLRLWSHLHRNYQSKKGFAPHKPVLLLAILDAIERGYIRENFIQITPELVALVHSYWRSLVPTEASWRERIYYPFRYLVHDGFWQLIRGGRPISKEEVGNPTCLSELSEVVDGAKFPDELWKILQQRKWRQIFKQHLLNTYFPLSLEKVLYEIPKRPLDYELERLKAEAQAKFRVTGVRETADEIGYYLRNALFPKVIRELYENRCAVCRIATFMPHRTMLVDAAHILPFFQIP